MNGRTELNQINAEIESAEKTYNEVKKEYRKTKQELKTQEAMIALKPKDEWKELGITNQQGRDAYIQTETLSLKETLNDLEYDVDSALTQVTICKNKLQIYLATLEE